LSSAKEKKGKERSEEKEKKRKEVRGDQLGGIVKDYKTLLFSNFQKKRICFVRVMSF
jgi:hypothetical protein